MFHNKLTTKRFNDEINKITNFGMVNSEIKGIIDTMNKKIEQFNEMLLHCGNFSISISDWFLNYYQSESESQCGGSTWHFSKFIGIADINGDFVGINYDKMDYYYERPDIFCLEFNLTIEIPYFTGSNLDIPNKKKRFNEHGSNWDLHLHYPKLERFKRNNELSERINYTTSLIEIPYMFEIDDLSKAYILCKFEEYVNFYMKLDKIREFTKKNDKHGTSQR